MIGYKVLAKVRRELDNILILMDELEDRGLPKDEVVKIILNESRKLTKTDEHPNEDKQA